MSRIVRAGWSPAGFEIGGKSTVLGSYGEVGARHPELDDYVWVDWFRPGTWKRASFGDGKPAGGYYRDRDLRHVGTAFVQ